MNNFLTSLTRYRLGTSKQMSCLVEDPFGNVTSSRVAGTKNRHLPVIDLDVDARLMSSKTPGHHQLYLDAPMSWRQYRRLLRALHAAGLIAPDFYAAARRRKMTVLRTTGTAIPSSVIATVPARAA